MLMNTLGKQDKTLVCYENDDEFELIIPNNLLPKLMNNCEQNVIETYYSINNIMKSRTTSQNDNEPFCEEDIRDMQNENKPPDWLVKLINY